MNEEVVCNSILCMWNFGCFTPIAPNVLLLHQSFLPASRHIQEVSSALMFHDVFLSPTCRRGLHSVLLWQGHRQHCGPPEHGVPGSARANSVSAVCVQVSMYSQLILCVFSK